MKKATKGAVVAVCENNDHVEILKEKVTSDLGGKYVTQCQNKKNRKIKIFHVDKEDCEDKKESWEKIEEQNGLVKNGIQEKIVHTSQNGKSKRMMVIAKVVVQTHKICWQKKK